MISKAYAARQQQGQNPGQRRRSSNILYLWNTSEVKFLVLQNLLDRADYKHVALFGRSKLLSRITSAMRLRGLIVRPSNTEIRCLNLDNPASILVPKTSRLTSRPSCAPDHEVKSLLVYGTQLALSSKTDTACQSSASVSSHVSPSSFSLTQIDVGLIFRIHPIMHKIFTQRCLLDAIKTLGFEVKTYARTVRNNA
jgi:hypothetical protein